ncbi:hypothetical protein [Nitrosomonas sp. Nm51]|nr:hypothetical protein [Nitrosomonas sp. Nm51]
MAPGYGDDEQRCSVPARCDPGTTVFMNDSKVDLNPLFLSRI